MTARPLGTAVLLDIRRGSVVTVVRRRPPNHGSVTGGIGRFCGGTFVAMYLDPIDDGLYASAGAHRIPVGRSSHADLSRGAFSLYIEIEITTAGHSPLRARKFATPASMFARLTDIPRDGLDHVGDEFLPIVAAIVNDPERQSSFGDFKDATAGPWELV